MNATNLALKEYFTVLEYVKGTSIPPRPPHKVYCMEYNYVFINIACLYITTYKIKSVRDCTFLYALRGTVEQIGGSHLLFTNQIWQPICMFT